MIYPQGSIETEMLSNENGICIFKAKVSDKEGNVLGTGTAYEKENSTFINKTSYIENRRNKCCWKSIRNVWNWNRYINIKL